MKTEDRIPLALLLLRLGVFVVMLMWTLDKFLHPEHTAAVFKEFYSCGGLGKGFFYMVGAAEAVLLAGFLVGYKKRFTYGAVLIFHAISTLSSFKVYTVPFRNPNLLFFAAWPMLAACFALYYLRELDTLWTVRK